ncbi:DegV family protein [Alkalihalophilus lindianensis]|uniref:DegV family protein n=1 Tax=Alkalihalophilus lindianensis TaxID=1630542 RepID=A0ABU3XA35_9BACI|nr:DegV family protein [Alkalihalophilus lindianensis]MDV2684299.1 DegV family protein [Alkalihalophilus lindianensis]
MNKVAIVTDSTAYLAPDVRDELSIEMVPLNVVIGEDSYQEEVDLTTSEFYKLLKETEKLPTTSQPAIGHFVETFEKLKAQGYEEIVTIHLSSKISGTYQSAMSAASMVEGINVAGFDSEISCSPQGFYVLEAAKMAKEGADAAAILTRLNEIKTSQKAYFMVDSLQHLHRGGRMNAAQLVVGNLLKIKPILHFVEGSIVPFEKVRTEKKAVARICQLLEEDVTTGGAYEVTVIHANRLQSAETIANDIQSKFDNVNVGISHFGPVIGTHLGEGSLGVGWYKVSQ